MVVDQLIQQRKDSPEHKFTRPPRGVWQNLLVLVQNWFEELKRLVPTK